MVAVAVAVAPRYGVPMTTLSQLLLVQRLAVVMGGEVQGTSAADTAAESGGARFHSLKRHPLAERCCGCGSATTTPQRQQMALW